MSFKPHVLVALLPVALLPLAACASGGGGGASPEEGGTSASVTVTVENRINPRTDVTVRMLTPTGQRVVLGSVGPGRTQNLTYRGNIIEGNSYQLEVVGARGQDYTSQPFVIFPGARIAWQLPLNSLNVFPPEGEGGG